MQSSYVLLQNMVEILSRSKEVSIRKEKHSFIQNNLKDLFVKNSFNVMKEFELKYLHTWKIKRNYGRIDLRTGHIDVYAKKEGIEIAIEYDNTRMLKWKSIEKLLQCKADICFGLIFGSVRADFSFKKMKRENIKRIFEILKDLKHYFKQSEYFNEVLKSKKFWFGVVNNDFLEEIKFD